MRQAHQHPSACATTARLHRAKQKLFFFKNTKSLFKELRTEVARFVFEEFCCICMIAPLFFAS
jgi:hypothetical protein